MTWLAMLIRRCRSSHSGCDHRSAHRLDTVRPPFYHRHTVSKPPSDHRHAYRFRPPFSTVRQYRHTGECELWGLSPNDRSRRLYRHTHATFEDYCRERWGMNRAHAYRLIDAATVAVNLSPMGDILPTAERQARPLTVLEPAQQREAWQRAVETPPTIEVGR